MLIFIDQIYRIDFHNSFKLARLDPFFMSLAADSTSIVIVCIVARGHICSLLLSQTSGAGL